MSANPSPLLMASGNEVQTARIYTDWSLLGVLPSMLAGHIPAGLLV